jgi:hypothetical protein
MKASIAWPRTNSTFRLRHSFVIRHSSLGIPWLSLTTV